MTQGIVAITQNGKVVLKIVTGCHGMNAKKVVAMLLQHDEIPSLREAYDIALRCDFGTPDRLAVLDENDAYHELDEPLSPSFRETFHLPEFNPRWGYGTADYTEVIEWSARKQPVN